jgi:quercetin dioxygenase-like cupin family protein
MTTEDEFVAGMTRDGFVTTPVSFAPNTTFTEHGHEFASRIFVTQGAITITNSGVVSVLVPGDTYALDVHEQHAEVVGPEGVTYLAARLHQA